MTLSKQTQRYIQQHPGIRDCLERGLVNYSALARHICEELGIEAFDAVQMACRRYKQSSSTLLAQERKAKALVHSAKLVLRTKIVVAVVKKGDVLRKALTLQQIVHRNQGLFRLIEGEDSFSIISTEDYRRAIEDAFLSSIADLEVDLTQISLIFPKQIATTIGVCAYLYKLFAENQINIRDEMSCWTDVMLIIKNSDAVKAVELLQNVPKAGS